MVLRELAFLLAVCTVTASAAPPVFEDLGVPVRVRKLAMEAVTQNDDGGFMAWAAFEAPQEHGLLGVNLQNGEITQVDISRFGDSHGQMVAGGDGNLYAYGGSPAHFLKYDVSKRELTDLGIPAQPANYSLGNAIGPDGKIYIGSNPQCCVVSCDPKTGKISSFSPLHEDKDSYLLYPAIGADGFLYCPVGLHHRELWSLNLATGASKQILPPGLTGPPGVPTVWVAADGNVYGKAGNKEFACHPDNVVLGKALPAKPRPPLRAGDRLVGAIDEQGKLPLTDIKTRKTTVLQTAYEGAPRGIYSVSCLRDGKVYGGTFSPAISFSYDVKSGKLADLGSLVGTRVQVYETLNHPRGLFLSSYLPASFDFFDPAKPLRPGENPRHITSVQGQERPVHFIPGPDGMLYAGTFPAKGRLGGALVRIDPQEFSARDWSNLVPNQSIDGLAAVPELGALFGTTSIQGGSSATPTEKEACVFLWDCKKETVTFTARPVPGTRRYGATVRGRDGLLYGVAETQFYVFDPKARKTVFTGPLPVKAMHFPDLADEPVGPGGLIYGLGDNAVFAINPVDRTARIVAQDPSLAKAFGFFVTPDEVLYYGSGAHLMHCRLHAP
jgi:outer membrane protein assembly factor BamB